jgi:hypothetical protein
MSVKDFRRAEQLDPNHGEVLGFVQTLRNNASDCFASALKQTEEKDYQEAVISLSLALEVMPDDMKCLVVRAAALRQGLDPPRGHQAGLVVMMLHAASSGSWACTRRRWTTCAPRP